MIGGGEKEVGWKAKCASTNSSGRGGWGPGKAHFKGEWCQSSIREALLQVLTWVTVLISSLSLSPA